MRGGPRSFLLQGPQILRGGFEGPPLIVHPDFHGRRGGRQKPRAAPGLADEGLGDRFGLRRSGDRGRQSARECARKRGGDGSVQAAWGRLLTRVFHQIKTRHAGGDFRAQYGSATSPVALGGAAGGLRTIQTGEKGIVKPQRIDGADGDDGQLIGQLVGRGAGPFHPIRPSAAALPAIFGRVAALPLGIGIRIAGPAGQACVTGVGLARVGIGVFGLRVGLHLRAAHAEKAAAGLRFEPGDIGAAGTNHDQRDRHCQSPFPSSGGYPAACPPPPPIRH